jgi:hypothetical protein
MPASSVNPDDDRVILTLGWGVHVESAALVLRFGVRKITMDLWLSGSDGGSDEQENGKRFHGSLRVSGKKLAGVVLHFPISFAFFSKNSSQPSVRRI